MFSVYQHWDPLKVCVVGRSYPPEFYSWITVPHVRSLFERIAIETEEDYQGIIKKLQEFGVFVMRPDLPENSYIGGKYLPPPMTPRDYMIMIGKTFYKGYQLNIKKAYADVADPTWPECNSYAEFLCLPQQIQDECNQVHHFAEYQKFYSSYDRIFDYIEQQGNNIIYKPELSTAPGAFITRVGKDLYFGTENYRQDQSAYKKLVEQEFPDYRTHIVDTGGHADGTFCPVCPGLIVSLRDVPTYADTFPDWEVVYLSNQSWSKVMPFMRLKQKNAGKWWIPGFEDDQAVIDTVESWLGHWTGYVEETVFDVNMLIIDPKNVMVFGYNKQVFDAFDRYGITAHVVPFRHRYFWDGGIHCVTCDLNREGSMQNFFSSRL